METNASKSFWKSLATWRTARRVLVGLAVLATAIAILYAEEDWRGRRAWEECKRGLEAQGHVLDWSALIPPPVPDDQNFFKAPHMQDWFVGRGLNDLSRRLGGFEQFYGPVAAVLEVRSPSAPNEASDLVLYFAAPYLTLTPPGNVSGAAATILPLIRMDNVPLTNAIENLARLANIRYAMDPTLRSTALDARGTPLLSARVSVDWTNVTARGALLALLNNYNLQLRQDAYDGTARITQNRGGEVVVDSATRRRLMALLKPGFEASTNVPAGRQLNSCRGLYSFVTGSVPRVPPVRIVLRAETPPAARELESMFRTPAWGATVWPTGTNSYNVRFRARSYSAADYVAWSDSFEPDFARIRDALKRPYARMDGDYSQPVLIPLPNFVTMRNAAQTLTDRAKCHLLLNQPANALADLTFMHDLCAILYGRPTGKPRTLVSAMINVAINGLYVDTIADGFRLNAWREPQWTALQEQLQHIDLIPLVASALECGPAAECRTLESSPPPQLVKRWSEVFREDGNLGMRLFLRLMPRGWMYQNMVVVATWPRTNGLDLANNRMFPGKYQDATRNAEQMHRRWSPFTILASIGVPNFLKAWQVTARNQTMANEAAVVCALERYHSAHRTYPESLEALAPQFITRIPHDLIGGQPLHYRRTGDTAFALYSVGWNETDDGGQSVLNENGTPQLDKGDWIWQ